MEGSRTRVVTVVIGSVILGALVGIGHVLWTRSAESEIVHYSWPVKWALTFAAESPDLPAGSRFSTAAVTNAEAEHWTVAGQVELPSNDGQRLVTTYTAEVRSRCSSFSERRCWEMDELSLGSVPVTVRAPAGERPLDERDSATQLAALPSDPEQPASDPAPVPQSGPEEAEDLAFILTEPLVEPTDALLEALGGWSTIHSPQSATPRIDPVLVRDIQRGLVALGYDPGPADGVPGRRTRTAIDTFRQREGMASGAIDFDLLDEINRRVGKQAASTGETAPAAAPDHATEKAQNRLLCAGVNPKDRDCDS